MANSVWVTARPHPSLAGLVDRFIGYRTHGAPGVHRGLPSGHLTFVVSVERDVDVMAHSDPTQQPSRYRSLVGGFHVTPVLIRHDGYQEGISIDLTPAGSRTLLGAPAAALYNTTADVDDVVGRVGTELWERVGSIGRWADRFAVCDEVLGRLAEARAPRMPNAQIHHAWQRLIGSGGETTVRSLAAEVGWSRQHLTRRFTSELGLSPKTAARVIRFDRARRMLQAPGGPPSLVRVSNDCGYYDQAHMTSEFTALAGCPPSQWLAAEQVPFVQDDS